MTLLPWLLNGTLDEGERAELSAHLAACAACRRELAGTREANELFASHAPATDLVAYAFGEPLPTLDEKTLAAHLDHCEDCRRELACIREDRSPDEIASLSRGHDATLGPVAALRRPDTRGRATRRTWLSPAALAAGVAAAALGGYWWRAQLPIRPSADLGVVELRASGHALRGEAAPAPSVHAGQALLLLLPTDDVTPYSSYRLEVAGADARVVWSSDSVRRQDAGDFALLLPAGVLAPGHAEIRLLARQGSRLRELERYPLEVAP